MKFLYPSIVFFTIAAVSSCKEDIPKRDLNGQTIQEIKSNTVYTTVGDSIVFQDENISKIYYLIRHAEKDTAIKDDPPLTQQGLDRATKLANILRGTRIDAIYSTLTLRTMFTIDSLADIKAMSILPYDNKNIKALIEEVETTSTKNRIFIVGHSNTIPALTNTLAKKDVFKKIFDEDEYDNFVIVARQKSGENVVYTLKY